MVGLEDEPIFRNLLLLFEVKGLHAIWMHQHIGEIVFFPSPFFVVGLLNKKHLQCTPTVLCLLGHDGRNGVIHILLILSGDECHGRQFLNHQHKTNYDIQIS